jgi:hypothetical protein
LNIRRLLVIHPFLFAAFPVLFLFEHNIRELHISAVIIPITFVLIVTSLMFFFSRRILRDDQKAAVLLSFVLVLFFSYEPCSSLVQDFRLFIGNFVIGPHKLYLITGGILFYFGAHFIIRTSRDLRNLTKIMNVVALSLVLIPSFSISTNSFTNWRAGVDNRGKSKAIMNEMVLDKTTKLPNIYYIILDAYGSRGILSEVYGYDNDEFINYLNQKGFYIADRSKSNYQSTFSSLASSLNLSYLSPADGFQEKKYSDNLVFSLMKQLGYTTVFASSLYGDVRMSNADFNLRTGWLDDFEYKLINLTPLPELLRRLHLSLGSYSRHRERIHHTFDTIAETTGWASPVFVYAHIFSPHPPFVFGPNGENVQPNREYSVNDATDFITEGGTRVEYIKGYREQIQYINKRLMKLINHILSRKDNFSVIILQADHGPRSMTDWSNLDKTYLKECYSILNAYYLPGNGNKVLYESITPVNTFRLVFNLYFGGRYDLLEDRSYYYNILLSPAIVDITIKTDNSKPRFMGKPSDSFLYPP